MKSLRQFQTFFFFLQKDFTRTKKHKRHKKYKKHKEVQAKAQKRK